MRILLTGGAGYVGSACLRWLLRHGHDPIAFDNLSEGNAAAVPSERLVVGDIEEQDAIAKALRDHRSEAVMHFAAVISVPESIRLPELYWRINVLGTKNVLDAMRECGIESGPARAACAEAAAPPCPSPAPARWPPRRARVRS